MLKAFADGRLFGSSFGPEPARVLALPGWRHDHRDFAAALDGLPALGIDPPGFGSTPEPPAAWGGARYAEAVAPILDAMDTPAVVVGHSFGGRIAVHLAAQRRGDVAGLVLTGVPNLVPRQGPRPRAPLAFRAAKLLNRAGLLSDERMEARRRRHGSADYRAATGVMRDVLVTSVNETYEEQLAAIRGPVELVWGADDDQAPVAMAERAAALLADAHLTVVPGTGHFLPTDRPDALRQAVERLLQRT